MKFTNTISLRDMIVKYLKGKRIMEQELTFEESMGEWINNIVTEQENIKKLLDSHMIAIKQNRELITRISKILECVTGKLDDNQRRF